MTAPDHAAAMSESSCQSTSSTPLRRVSLTRRFWTLAPGFLSRVERQIAFKANGRRTQETIDSNSEVYTVRDSVWQRTGLEPGGGCLCIGCLEKRLGRRLKSEDFDHYDPYNDPSLPGTHRLLERRGKPKGR